MRGLNRSRAIEVRECPVEVRVGEYQLASDGALLSCVGLGSCVACVLYDPVLRCGAMAHIQLPRRGEAVDKVNPFKFADTSIVLMVRALEDQGSFRCRLQAKLFGGADMFPEIPKSLETTLGYRNQEIIREELASCGIPVVAEDVGGHLGRTIVFDLRDGRVRVRDVKGTERIY